MSPRLNIDQNLIGEFCRKWKITELSIFGSALREDFGPESDIDILVNLDPVARLSLYDWVDMIDELKGILGRDVDLLDKSALRNPFRKREILSTAKVLYAA